MKKKKNSPVAPEPFTPYEHAWDSKNFRNLQDYLLFEENRWFADPDQFFQHLHGFVGTPTEFAAYCDAFIGDWTSVVPLEPAVVYSEEAIALHYELALLNEDEIAKRIELEEYELCAEYLYGEDVVFDGFGKVVINEFDSDIECSDEELDALYYSRSDGNHSRYRRRCDEARCKRNRIQLAIPEVRDDDGNLEISGGMLWQKYTNACEMYKYYKLLKPSFKSLKLHVNLAVLENLIATIRKYKKDITLASHFSIYYDGRFFAQKPHVDTAPVEKPSTVSHDEPSKKLDYVNSKSCHAGTASKKHPISHCNLKDGVETHLAFEMNKHPLPSVFHLKYHIRWLPLPCYPACY